MQSRTLQYRQLLTADSSFKLSGAQHAPDSRSPVEILGIDVGGSGIKGALVDIRTGKFTSERHRIKTPPRAEPKAVAKVVARLVEHFSWTGTVGCCFPARIKNGIAKTAANIDQTWIGTNVAELFSRIAGCPFGVLNDADAAAVAEMTFGAGKGLKGVVLLLTFGTGIGSAIFTDDVLIPNTELGHVYLHGMVAEHYASDRVRKEQDLSWEEWAARAQEYLTHIERLFDIDTIILGGGASKPKKSAKYLDLLRTDAEIITARLKNEAGIIGAAYSARRLAAGQ